MREIVYIKHSLFELIIKGRPKKRENLFKSTKVKQEKIFAEMSVDSNEDVEIQVYSDESEELIEFEGGKVYPCFFENSRHEIIIYQNTTEEIEFYHDDLEFRKSITKDRKGNLSGIIDFKSNVGYSKFEIRSKNKNLLTLKIEVFPTKMDYKEDYKNLLKEITEEVHNLAFSFLKKTYGMTKLKRTDNQTEGELYSIIKYIQSKLEEAVSNIEKNPHTKLEIAKEIKEASKVKRVDGNSLNWLMKNSHQMAKSDKGIKTKYGNFIPEKMVEQRKKVSYDTFENRFVKWVIKSIIKKLREIENHHNDESFKRNVSKMIAKNKKLLNRRFLKEAKEMSKLESISLVMQMKTGYKEVYKYYLMMMKGLSVESDIFEMSLKEIHTLYEYWCFLKLNKIFRKHYELIGEENLIKVENTKLYVSLKKVKNAKVRYRNPINGEIFELAYNLNTSSGEYITTKQKPDNMLTIEKENSEFKYKYVFDAKYKIEKKGSELYPKEEDINTMHRYRDSIMAKEEDGTYKRETFGAYIMFPHSDEKAFESNKYYKSIEEINIGALPFLPNNTKLLENHILNLICSSSDSIQERDLKTRGSEEYIKYKYSDRNMIIGSLRRVSQLDMVLKEKLYYIPYNKEILNNKIIDYVCLYQSKKQFKENSGIKYYGKVKDFEIMLRQNIKGINKIESKKNNLYIVFNVEKWDKRKKPIEILSEGQNNAYRYTTYRLFKDAKSYSMLLCKNKKEELIYRDLERIAEEISSSKVEYPVNRKICGKYQLNINEDVSKIRIDNSEIKLLTNNLKFRPKQTINTILNNLQLGE